MQEGGWDDGGFVGSGVHGVLIGVSGRVGDFVFCILGHTPTVIVSIIIIVITTNSSSTLWHILHLYIHFFGSPSWNIPSPK